ncbi:MAG: hypothetical protein WC898_02360 [Candidatus Paceibacterota bacterium]|jgi:hypothetical protein
MGNIADASMLLRALGYGIFPAVIVLVYLTITITTKFLGSKQDKDRIEHMAKWDSMIDVQRQAISKQALTMESIIKTHQDETTRLIDNHREETDRMYKLYERQADSLDVISHNLSIQSRILETKHFCPNDIKKG